VKIAERTGAGIEMVAAVLFTSGSDLSIERLVEEGNGLRARDLLERQAINRLRAQVFESHRGIVTRIVKEKMSWSDWREKNQARANSVMEAMDTILASKPFDIARYAVAQGTLADLAQR
jgi:NAD-specific glutamate dehydrogenase